VPETPYRTGPFSLRPGDDFQLSRAGLEITESGFLGRIHLRGSGERFRAFVCELFGVPSLPPPLRSATSRSLTLLGLGPDEWMVLGSPDQPRQLLPRLSACLRDVDGLAVDVSSAFATLRVSGPGSAALLRKGCSVPLEHIASGDCLRTRVGRYHVLIHCSGRGPVLNLHAGRSYARSFRNWIADAASL
jgi:sarcosine oxidase subunit gamma